MRLAICLFVAGVAGATAAFHGVATDAAPTVVHVADLPPGVIVALGLTLADPGMPYQASDVIDPSRPLPAGRLIWARRDGATWRIEYEHGGRGHYYGLATLRPVATGWAVTTERSLVQRKTP